MNPAGYVHEIQSIEKEEKRIRARAKKLREQKKQAQERLFRYMEEHGLDVYSGISKKSVQPRQRRIRKKSKDKKRDAFELFRQTGIPDPEKFWSDFQNTQKALAATT